jgi:hypothetical protein
MKVTVLGQHNAFWFASSISFDGFSCNLKPCSSYVCATSGVRFRESVSHNGHFIREKTTFRPYYALHRNHVSENLYIKLTRLRLKVCKLCMKSVSNEGHITWRPKFFVRLSLSIGVMSRKLHISHIPRMRYKRCNFGGDRSIMKGTLHISSHIIFEKTGQQKTRVHMRLRLIVQPHVLLSGKIH